VDSVDLDPVTFKYSNGVATIAYTDSSGQRRTSTCTRAG